ncbi:hypothetical protein [Methylobacterium soli]|uniref:hypothetical protein n=1 Tax=Methylobacterium soli TaxID=553447 RepID=UPI001781BE16|nr:hypothetical protein [Methylobacterium soli]GJE44623.1 hypothetical protein AEGHOMDF_3812 [Methylobacterium soli]
MRLETLLAACLLATPALAQDYNRTDLIRGLCQPDGCDEFSVISVDPVRTTSEGSLKRTRLKTFRASYSGRIPRAEETGYVYCSQTKPAVIAEKQGRTVGILLAPFATEDPRETVRRYTNFTATYFAICHGSEAGRRAVRDLRSLAQSLGYRVPATRSQVVDLKRAEDIITHGMGGQPMAAKPEWTRSTETPPNAGAPESNTSSKGGEERCGELSEALGLCAMTAFVKEQVSAFGD